MRNLFLGILATVLLAGCANITSGDICAREFVPAHVESELKLGTDNILTSETVHVPNRWYIIFRKVDEKNGGWLTRRVEVEEATYQKSQLGEHFSVEP